MGPRGRKVLGDVESSRIVGCPWEGRLGGEQCEQREEPRRKGLQPAAWRFVFSQRGIHIKTPAPRVPSVRSLVPLPCRAHPHAGRVRVCESMVPRMQHEFNQRSEAPYAQAQTEHLGR